MKNEHLTNDTDKEEILTDITIRLTEDEIKKAIVMYVNVMHIKPRNGDKIEICLTGGETISATYWVGRREVHDNATRTEQED